MITNDTANEKRLIDTLKEMAGKASFVSFTYTNKQGETSRYTIIFGADYRKQVEESLLALELLRPTYTEALQIQAAEELMASFRETLTALDNGTVNSRYTKPDAYVTICAGMKYNIAGGTINVSGLSHAKTVLVPGDYPKVNSRPLTLAKNTIRDTLPISRWREFVITPEKLSSARLQGQEIILG